MAAPAQVMHVPAGLPIDEAGRPEVMTVGNANLSNVNVRAGERGSLVKRLGFDGIPTDRLDATTRSAGNRLCMYRDTLCTIDGTNFDAYAEETAASVVASRVPEASATSRTLATVAGPDGVYDVVHCNGYIATATLRELRVVVSVEDTRGVVVRGAETLFTSGIIQAVASLASYSTYIFLLALDSSAATIQAYYLDTASAATITAGWVSIGALCTNKITTGYANKAMSVQSLTNRIAIAYVNDSAGASQLSVKTFTIAGVTESTTVNTSTVTPGTVAIEGSIADTLWVAWNEDTLLRLKGLDADVLATTLASTVTIMTYPSIGPDDAFAEFDTPAPFIVSSSVAGKGRISVNDPTSLWLMRGFQTTAGAAAADGAGVIIYGLFQQARPVNVGGRYYGLFHGCDEANTSAISVLCDYTDVTNTTNWVRPVASAFPGLAVGSGFLGASHPWVISSTSVAYVVTVNRSALTTVPELVTYDFADRLRWQPAMHNGSLFLSGGILSYYDGRRVAEAAFLHAPRTPTTAESGTGPTTTLGGWRYVATYEEVDSAGNWSVSAVSQPSDATGSFTNKTIDVTTHPLSMSGRLSGVSDGRVRVSIYRTLDGGEPPYYFVASDTNQPSSDVVIADDYADASIIDNRKLYAPNLPGVNGDAQDRRAPGFVQDLVSYGSMLVIATGSDLWWSGQTVDGEGTWFSPAFYVPIAGDGYVTALATQDGTLYAFKRRSISALAGEAPSDNGAFGGLGTPRQLSVDVGCIDPNSVVVTSLGIFFQSDRGIEVLNRSGEVVWIGEQVQDTLASFPVISSAKLDTNGGYVRFSLAESTSGGRVSGDGRDLVFDLTIKAWISVDDKRGLSSSEASQDAAMIYYGGVWRYGWLGTDGFVYYERLQGDARAYLDGVSYVTAQYELPPWKFGLQQEQRVYEMEILFERYSAAGLTIEVATDYGDYGDDDKVWAESATADQKELPFRPKPYNHAVQLRVKDTAPTPIGDEDEDGVDDALGTGKGFTFIGISADIAPKQGSTRGTPRLATGLRR